MLPLHTHSLVHNTYTGYRVAAFNGMKRLALAGYADNHHPEHV